MILRTWHTKNSHGIQNVQTKRQEPKRKKVKLKIIVKKDGESKKGKEAAKELKKQLIQMKRNSGEGQKNMEKMEDMLTELTEKRIIYFVRMGVATSSDKDSINNKDV